MNAESLRQYRAYKRRAGKICRGKAMPRIRHLAIERGAASPKPIWRPGKSYSQIEKAEQDVEKGLGRIVLAGKELVDIFRKPDEPE